MIKAVIFDFGNTLFHEEPIDDVAGKLLPEIQGLPRYLDVYRALGLRFDNICEASLDAVAYYYVSRKLGGRIDLSEARRVKEAIARILSDHLKPIDGVKEVIRDLKNRGYKIAIVSNASSQEAVEFALEREGVAELFDAIVTSRLVGVRKPDPRIFLYTLDLIEVRPSDAVFVGDREYEDICGAKSVGMKAVQVVVEGLKPSACADAYISSLPELLRAIENI